MYAIAKPYTDPGMQRKLELVAHISKMHRETGTQYAAVKG